MERFDLVVIGSGPAGEKGAAQAAYFGKSRRSRRAARRARRRLRPHRDAALQDPARDRALPDRVPAARALRHDAPPGPPEEPPAADRPAPRRDGGADAADQAQLRTPPDHDDRGPRALPRPAHDRRLRRGGRARRGGSAFDAALVAAGSSPLPPRGLTFDDPDVEDSDRILDLDRIPKSLAVVGGGVIGCEYASHLRGPRHDGDADRGARPAPRLPRRRGVVDAEDRASSAWAERCFSATRSRRSAARRISRRTPAAHVEIRARARGGQGPVLGRAPRKHAGARPRGGRRRLRREGRIPVDDHFQTNVPRIYAAGDVVGFPALAATAMEQGRVAACHAFDIPFKTAVARLFPYGVYTIPEVSMIGATEEELKEKGIAVRGRPRALREQRAGADRRRPGRLREARLRPRRREAARRASHRRRRDGARAHRADGDAEGRRPRRLHPLRLQLPDARRVLQVRGVRRPAAPFPPQGGAPLDGGRSRGVERRGPSPGARLVRRDRPHRPLRPREPPGDARPHGSVAARSLRHVDATTRKATG